MKLLLFLEVLGESRTFLLALSPTAAINLFVVLLSRNMQQAAAREMVKMVSRRVKSTTPTILQSQLRLTVRFSHIHKQARQSLSTATTSILPGRSIIAKTALVRLSVF